MDIVKFMRNLEHSLALNVSSSFKNYLNTILQKLFLNTENHIVRICDFQDPVPAEPWSGKRDASKFGNKSVQINEITHKIEGSEDCLYLNVYTTNITPSKKRAVMVWIHGGAFCQGSGDAVMYGPDYIVQKDVVLVTLNYRLGILGTSFVSIYIIVHV